MLVLKTREALVAWRRTREEPIAFVPTMGFFHEGHVSLMQSARALADTVVVSLFVNPSQFGPGEDLSRYPRDFDSDVNTARREGVSVLFAPEVGEMYEPDHATYVHWPELGARLCGESRPIHFQGVGTIVLKLFNLVRPTYAVFGRKDGQQALLMQRLVTDLDLPVSIIIAPTVREPDGLAMSSRNSYLSTEQRPIACGIYRALKDCRDRILRGELNGEKLIGAMNDSLHGQDGLVPDYVEIVDRSDLSHITTVHGNCMAAIAARVGTTRLIDNLWTFESDGAIDVQL